ncbi:tumor necrosis factor receptor superfamily member 6 [Pyxicephalus adspersus]|uniref:tumor necrosis factor receptor superfamily member 6 n=1 Tax=Pyxicephalus adspersus TaxID=30357 RepID=UPI003B591A5F
MVSLRAFVILVIIHCHFAFSMKIFQDSSDEHVKKKDDLFHRLFKRQQSCDKGEYHGEKHCCKLCGEGTHVESECTEPHGEPACRECTEGVDFMDKINGYPECQKCRHCDPGLGQKVLQICTASQNTVCECKEGFFCSDDSLAGQSCSQCRHCTHKLRLCTQNCKLQIFKNNSTTKSNLGLHRNHLIAAILAPIVGLILISVAIYFCIRRKNEICNQLAGYNTSFNQNPVLECPPNLENISLETHLYDIASILGQKSVLKLVTKTLTAVEIEEIKTNYSNNAREEKYELLKKWYNVKGRQGALKCLIKNSTKWEAENIIEQIKITDQHAEP